MRDLTSHLAPGSVLLGTHGDGAALRELPRHAVEATRQIAQLVVARPAEALVQVAGSQAPGVRLELLDRLGRPARHEERQEGGREEADPGGQQERTRDLLDRRVDVGEVGAHAHRPATRARATHRLHPLEGGLLLDPPEGVVRVHAPGCAACGLDEREQLPVLDPGHPGPHQGARGMGEDRVRVRPPDPGVGRAVEVLPDLVPARPEATDPERLDAGLEAVRAHEGDDGSRGLRPGGGLEPHGHAHEGRALVTEAEQVLGGAEAQGRTALAEHLVQPRGSLELERAGALAQDRGALTLASVRDQDAPRAVHGEDEPVHLAQPRHAVEQVLDRALEERTLLLGPPDEPAHQRDARHVLEVLPALAQLVVQLVRQVRGGGQQVEPDGVLGEPLGHLGLDPGGEPDEGQRDGEEDREGPAGREAAQHAPAV